MTTTLLVAAYTMWVWYYPDVGWELDPQNYATKEECMAAIEHWSNHLRGTALEAMDNDKDADKYWPHCLLSSESPDVPNQPSRIWSGRKCLRLPPRQAEQPMPILRPDSFGPVTQIHPKTGLLSRYKKLGLMLSNLCRLWMSLTGRWIYLNLTWGFLPLVRYRLLCQWMHLTQPGQARIPLAAI